MAMTLPESGAKQVGLYVVFLDVALANELVSVFFIFPQPFLISLRLSRCHSMSGERFLCICPVPRVRNICAAVWHRIMGLLKITGGVTGVKVGSHLSNHI